MTDVGEPTYIVPHATPEPHCIPGYTGYIPGYGPKRIYQMAKTYGHMTHDLMVNHPVAGQRLESTMEIGDVQQRQTGRQTSDMWRTENNMINQPRRQEVIPGYTGHIPRKTFQVGKNYTLGSQKAAEEYKHYQKKKADLPYTSVHSNTNIFPARSFKYDTIPHLLNRSRKIPLYADYRNTMNYNTPPINARVLNRQNRCSTPAYNALPPGASNDVSVQRRQQFPRQNQGSYFTRIDNERRFSNSQTNGCCCKCHDQRF